jgi:methylated-DNA-protein-cysteine methyltransferase related protein
MQRQSPRQSQRTSSAKATRADDPTSKIYAVVRSIPRGRVATYGEIAALAGLTSGHRIAARVMRSCPEALPWQRVLGKKDARRGQINIEVPEHAALQRALLESERVVFDENGFVPLREYGWLSAPSAGAHVQPAQRSSKPRGETHAGAQARPGARALAAPGKRKR